MCKVCSAKAIALLYRSDKQLSITSDLRLWKEGIEVFQCKACGCVFKKPDKSQLKKIYQHYQLFEDSEENDQAIFISGKPQPRTRIIVDSLSLARLPGSGKFLDIGCNKGFLLKQFSGSFPGWSVFGHELSRVYENYVKKIPHFGGFYSGEISNIRSKFDLISMIHTLEHIENPQKFLKSINKLLTPDGSLLIQVPNLLQNPFDILVFEHISHFSPQTLEQMLINAGFEVVLKSTQIVPKELTFIAKPNRRYGGSLKFEHFLQMTANENVEFLKKFEELVVNVAQRKPLVVFGTAEVGTWVAGLLDGEFDFFVDESPWRIGKKHLGKKIFHPGVLKGEENVILAMAPILSKNIMQRWKDSNARFLYPV